MLLAWVITSTILGIIWLIVFCVGNFFVIVDPDEDYKKRPAGQRKKDYQIFAANMTGALIVVLFHWIVALLIVPVFVCYGVFSGIKLLIARPWKKTLELENEVRK